MPVAIPKNELNEFSLPRVCVVTGERNAVTFQPVRFQWQPPWIVIFAVAPLFFLVFMLAFRKTANGTLPFSDAGWEAVKAARRNAAFTALGIIGALVAFGALAGLDNEASVLIFIGAIVVGVLAIAFSTARVRKVFPAVKSIDDKFVHLKFASPEAEQLFTAHLNAGARPAA